MFVDVRLAVEAQSSGSWPVLHGVTEFLPTGLLFRRKHGRGLPCGAAPEEGTSEAARLASRSEPQLQRFRDHRGEVVLTDRADRHWNVDVGGRS